MPRVDLPLGEQAWGKYNIIKNLVGEKTRNTTSLTNVEEKLSAIT